MPATRWIASVVVLVIVGCGSGDPKVSESAVVATNAGSVAAQPPKDFNYDTFWVMGVGLNDCGKMTADRRTAESLDQQSSGPGLGRGIWNAAYTHYATGFISGTNFRAYQARQGNPNVGEDISPEGLLAATEQYCEQHPLDKVVVALRDVYLQLAVR